MFAPRLVVVVLVGFAATAARADDATTLEERAFTAIEGEKWCLAMRLFEGAHQVGPAVGLMQNAAQAAEFGGDFGNALRFVDEIGRMGGATPADRATAKKKAADLTRRIAKSGAGAPCAGLDELQGKSTTPQTTTTTTTTPPPTTPPTQDAPPVAPEPVDNRSYGYIGAGLGGAAVVVGGATVAVGLVPWFAHAGALEKIKEAEGEKADATAFQSEQAAAREGWESYGQALAVAGTVVVTVGVAALAGGVGFALLGPAPDEP